MATIAYRHTVSCTRVGEKGSIYCTVATRRTETASALSLARSLLLSIISAIPYTAYVLYNTNICISCITEHTEKLSPYGIRLVHEGCRRGKSCCTTVIRRITCSVSASEIHDGVRTIALHTIGVREGEQL